MGLIEKIDDLGKPAWIALVVLSFILFWPIGIALLVYLKWSGRMFCSRHYGHWDMPDSREAREKWRECRRQAREEWREWKKAHLIPASPFLYLAVRDDIDKRRLLKTKTGVSVHVPTIELTEAEATGRLQAVFRGILRDIYSKWAHISGSPPPPAWCC